MKHTVLQSESAVRYFRPDVSTYFFLINKAKKRAKYIGYFLILPHVVESFLLY